MIFTVTHLYVDNGYRAEFSTLEAAKADVKRCGFSAAVAQDGRRILTWCPIAGWQSRGRS